MIDLHQLKIFVAVANEGSLTRASEVVFLSQSAVSGQIKALEEGLELTLFERKSRGMRLTPAGKILLVEANLALSAANKVTAKAQFLRRGVHGDCRIGIVSEPVIIHLEKFLATLIGRHPELRLSFLQGMSGDIIDRILQGTLDAGYIIGNVDDSRLESIKIAPVTLRIVGPNTYADRMRDADWESLALLPWISTPEKCSYNQMAMQMFTRQGVTPKAIIEADQESTLRRLVASGVGLTLLREDVAVAAENQGEVFIWEGWSESSHLCFIYPKAVKSNPKLVAILEVLKEVWELPSTLLSD